MSETKRTAGLWETREMTTHRMFPSTTILGKSKRGDAMRIGEIDLRKDAAFIVRACNNFDDLLAALKELLTIIERCGEPVLMSDKGKWLGPQFEAAKANARDAIAGADHPQGFDSSKRWGNSAVEGVGTNSPAMMEARAAIEKAEAE